MGNLLMAFTIGFVIFALYAIFAVMFLDDCTCEKENEKHDF